MAIGCAFVYYDRAAQAFIVGIKCRYCGWHTCIVNNSKGVLVPVSNLNTVTYSNCQRLTNPYLNTNHQKKNERTCIRPLMLLNQFVL